MALSDYRITEADYKNKDIAALPVRPTISAAELQAAFDRLVKEVVVPKLNAMLEELASAVGANAIGKAVSGMSGQSAGELLEELAAEKAPLASPGFTGTPTAPTPNTDTNTAQIATTAFVQAVAKQIVLTAGSADMTAAIYDPQGKRTDVYTYADEAARHTVFTLTLPVNDWQASIEGFEQEIEADEVEAAGYSYIVAPSPVGIYAYGQNGVYMGDVYTNGRVKFYAATKPNEAITVNVLKVHVIDEEE